jgi:hypothetical protein
LKAKTEVPLLQISLIQEVPLSPTSPSSLKYVAVRILPLSLESESATLQLLYFDLLMDLKTTDSTQALAESSPSQYIDQFNMKLMSPEERTVLVDIYQSQIAVQVISMFLFVC